MALARPSHFQVTELKAAHEKQLAATTRELEELRLALAYRRTDANRGLLPPRHRH